MRPLPLRNRRCYSAPLPEMPLGHRRQSGGRPDEDGEGLVVLGRQVRRQDLGQVPEFAHEDVRGAHEEATKAAGKNSKKSSDKQGSGVPEAEAGKGDGGPSIPHPVPGAETTP